MTSTSLRRIAAAVAGAVACAGLAVATTPAPASADGPKFGTRSLAQVLAKDGVGRLDGNWRDYDIAEKAVYKVLRAKSNSPLAVLADGRTRLTLFLPTDAAFRRFVEEAGGRHVRTEGATWRRLGQLADVATLEQVLLYHGTPQRLNADQVARAARGDGTAVRTFQGGTVRVVKKRGDIRLVDKDPQLFNPLVILPRTNINKGNRQLAHAIDRVLLPVNL
jgi:uncharacterized surface protein with fasciclin (FAS1) repeats